MVLFRGRGACSGVAASDRVVIGASVAGVYASIISPAIFSRAVQSAFRALHANRKSLAVPPSDVAIRSE